MYQLLSYQLTEKAPGWPNNPTLRIEPNSLISEGKVTNEYKLTLFNHFGSHMDGPKHFNDKGPHLAEMPLETFIYEKPLLLDIPKTFGELVTVNDLKPYESQILNADLLLIRSGFSEKRHNFPEEYASKGPGISSEACRYMMDHFRELKTVALDWISLASYADMKEGILAHQYLLGMFHDHFICIIEDLNFSQLNKEKLKRVFALPLFIEGVDSAPVTVLAEIDN